MSTNPINVLHPGSVEVDLFDSLIELSAIRSEKVVFALKEHLVYGASRKEACSANGVNIGYFSISLGRIERVFYLVKNIFELLTLES